MKKKDEIILEIADVNFPNKAYGYYEGEKVIVKNAVPGQKVQAQVFKKRGSGVEAGGHRTLSDGKRNRNVFPLCTLRRLHLSDHAA